MAGGSSCMIIDESELEFMQDCRAFDKAKPMAHGVPQQVTTDIEMEHVSDLQIEIQSDRP